MFVYRDGQPTSAEQERHNDIEAAILLSTLVINLANLGTDEQKRGRTRDGKFVARPVACDAQVELERALLSVSKRIAKREVW